MFIIFLTVLSAAAVSADSTSVSYQSSLKNYRDYEGYPTYMSARPSNFEPSAPDYISPYSKSDHDVYQSDASSPENLYYNDGAVSDTLSSSSSNEARTAYYKTKYASENAANALRASPSPSTVINEVGGGSGQNQPDYSPLQSAEYSTSASYSVGSFGERQPQQQSGGINHHRPGEETAAALTANDYVKPSSGGAVYGTYSNNAQGVLEYPQRPSPFAHSSPSQSEYSSPSHLPSTHTYTDYLPHHTAAYKAYSAPKYQSLLGALKSLFGGGDSPTVSASGHYPIYYSPQSPPSGPPPGSAASLHHPGGPHGSPSVPVPAAAAPSYYYSGAGPPSSLGSSSPYSKSYMSMPTMRFVHGPSPSSPIPSGAYGAGGLGGRIVLVRDSSGAHTSAYPSHLSPAGVMAPSASYPPTRSRYYFSPAAGGPSSTGPSLFYSAAAAAAAAQNAAMHQQSPQTYTSVSPSSSPLSSLYPGAGSSFAAPAHHHHPASLGSTGGGSTFLGYSM